MDLLSGGAVRRQLKRVRTIMPVLESPLYVLYRRLLEVAF